MAHDPALLPFLRGPNAFTVSLRPIDPDRWLVPDDQAHWLVGKAALIDADRDAVFAEMPGSVAGQTEAADRVAAAIGTAWGHTDDEPPLLAASRRVSDDLCLLEPRGGEWMLTALSLCAPTFFSAHEAIGGSLAVLHGPVPDRLGAGGQQGLAARIARIFTALPADQVLERHNWTVQWGDTRHTPDWRPVMAAADAADTSTDTALAGRHLHLRVERQTISRLPQTGGVLFTIRIRHTRLAPLMGDAAVRAAFVHAWTQTPPEVRAYKRWRHLERHVAALLDG
jgi:hypothetical protein